MTNKEFAALVGCHVTTASAYRNGRRLPGVDKLERIRGVVGLSHDDVLALHAKGKEAFGEYLRLHVFAPQEREAA